MKPGSVPLLICTVAVAALAHSLGPAEVHAGPDPTVSGAVPSEGRLRALVIFAEVGYEQPSRSEPPAFAASFFDPDLPGSLAHYFDAMSFGRLRLRGEVAPRVYATPLKDKDQAVRAILEAVDRDLDLGRFDADGPDGLANSGDDDGVVDYIFLNLGGFPPDFLLVDFATGQAGLGRGFTYRTRARSPGGAAIRVASVRGSIQRVTSFAQGVGIMAHEFGHALGLSDLYDPDFVRNPDISPERDGGGIGRWGLMGFGGTGWSGTGVDAPNPLCAWSRLRLGWVQRVISVSGDQRVEGVGPVGSSGTIVRIPINPDEAFLLENRSRMDFYDRNIPGEGILIWHVDETVSGQSSEERKRVSLEEADGRFRDAGAPLGSEADPRHGGGNIDFWAHDEAYERAHAGNLGDGGDPFGAPGRDLFGLYTNPASRPNAPGSLWEVSDMRVDDDGAASFDAARIGFSLGPGVRETWTGDITLTGGRFLIGPEDEVRVEPPARFHLRGSVESTVIRVEGSFTLASTPDAPITLGPHDPDRRWGGFEVAGDGELRLEGVVILGARRGVRLLGPASASSSGDQAGAGPRATLHGCRISGAAEAGILAGGGRVTLVETSVEGGRIGLDLRGAVVTLRDTEVLGASVQGVRVGGGTFLRMEGAKVAGSGSTGLWVEGSLARIEIVGGEIRGSGAGGVHVRRAARFDCRGARLAGNGAVDLAVELAGAVRIDDTRFGGGSLSGLEIGTDDFEVVGAHFGRYEGPGARLSGSGIVRGCVFEGSGLEVVGRGRSLAPNLSENRFSGADVALEIVDSSPEVWGNRFEGNGIAVVVEGSASPDLSGVNVFVDNGVAIRNRTRGAVRAQRCWWGTTDPLAVLASVEGPVAVDPILPGDPDLFRAFALGLPFPNPSVGPVSISLDVPIDAARKGAPMRAEVAVYNAMGQFVKPLAVGELAGGPHRIAWDGTDARGQRAAAGVYFIRMAGEGGFTRVAKALRLSP